MAKNTTPKLIRELERVFGAMLYDGPVKAAERVVTELQQEGPSWILVKTKLFVLG